MKRHYRSHEHILNIEQYILNVFRDLGKQFESRSLNIDTSVIVIANSDQTLEEPNLQTWLKSSQWNAVCTKTHKAAH